MELTDNALTVLKSRYLKDGENWDDCVKRIIKEISRNDSDENFISNTKDVIYNLDFIPAGRILRNIGKIKPAMMNCNLIPIEDNIESIGEAIKSSLIIASFGGGCGYLFSALRPKGATLSTKGGESSGMCSFIKAIDITGQTIESGGQRRSANIAICDIGHPEIEEFVSLKSKQGEISQFNLSVGVNNLFLEAVERDSNWDLIFNNTVYKTISARKLWLKIIKSMVDTAEPGIIYMDNLKKNNTYYFQPIIGTNPCGEQPLGNWGSCCLGAINLNNCVNGKRTDWIKLENLINTGVRFLDNIIDINYYPIQELEVVAKESRRIGLGIMGLAEYFFKKEIRYGSQECLNELEKLFKFFSTRAYNASIELAKIKKPFPKFDKVQYGKASFIRKLPVSLRMRIKEFGIRNSNIITAQPTGTTSLIPNVTGGIEPLFSKAYLRKDRISERVYIHPIYEKMIENNEEIPDYFVDSFDLTPEEHLSVQATLTKYNDSAISKTINLPSDYTADKLDKLLLEYIYDLKGVTVYRDGCRDGQVLNRITLEEAKEYIKSKKTDNNLQEQDVSCASGKCTL